MPRRALSAAVAAAAVLITACSSSTPTDVGGAPAQSVAATTPVPMPIEAPTATEPVEPVEVLGPVGAPVRHPASERPIYFVMPDRFANGDRANDTAGLDGGPLVHGFDPTRRGFHHGGDLAGLTERLRYLDALGIGAIWITPPFANNFVQGDGTLEGSSSSYHGYWQVDFDRIDPHLGTEAEMQAFIAEAHRLGMHVYFDIVVNHTGDVIQYAEDSYVYWSTTAAPYRDADGNEFDLAAVAGSEEFPALDPAQSFPYTPVFATEQAATSKSPAWLNDVTLYHNRGNSTFNGESDIYGDFFGLDDLFTEHPRVVEGMIDLYSGVIARYDIDGFRIDTMKHVNDEFWAEFAHAIRERAAALGKPDFFMFGEVFNTDPIKQSSYTNLGVSATLDFIVNDATKRFASGGSGADLRAALDDDDWFTDVDNNASMQVTFLGNHDEGRLGYFLDRSEPGASPERLLARAKLAYAVLFALRGTPTIYYGDEQGFVGDGGDQLARQDMFPSLTPEYIDDVNIGSEVSPAADNFDRDHPMYEHLAALARLRREHPALVTGAQLLRETDGPVVAFSRIDRDELVEYVVIANSNASLTVPARFTIATPSARLEAVWGSADPVVADERGEVFIEVPPLTMIVLRSDRSLEPTLADSTPTVSIVRPTAGTVIPTNRYRIEAEVTGAPYAEVTFAARIDGAEPVVLGVDDAPPYRVYWSTESVPTGAVVELMATVMVGAHGASDRVEITMGDRD